MSLFLTSTAKKIIIFVYTQKQRKLTVTVTKPHGTYLKYYPPNMKNIILSSSVTLLIYWFILSLPACSKGPKCWGKDENQGIIDHSIIIDPNCEFNFLNGTAGEFVITEDTLFTQTFSNACSLPDIDFTKFTVLGIETSGSCETKFIREVTRLTSEKKYLYKVTVKECGLCKKLSVSHQWVVVPKLPIGWTVSFETIHK